MQIDIAEYYKKYGPMVLRRCRALLKDEDSAMDAMQEVFVKLLQYEKRLTGEFPSSLLYRIATNICLNMIRSEKRIQLNCDEFLINIAACENFEDRITVKDFLDRIFEKEQVSTNEIAVMHYVDRMTLEEVAGVVGLSVSGVRKRLRNLRSHVKILEEA